MRIEVVTMWYNEAFLAPFFLNHYSWVDRITILLDTDTDDDTEQIALIYPGVAIEPFTFPDGMDDILKIERINQFAAEAQCDWLIAVDADEFIHSWPVTGLGPRASLRYAAKDGHNLVRSQLYQVYRHKTDKDLDPAQDTIWQRRHGDPDVNSAFNKLYCKPIIVKPEVGIQWRPGCHSYVPNPAIREAPKPWIGAHWANADPCFCVERRIRGRRDRMSKRNKQLGLTYQHHNVTEAEILALCRRHLDDPRLF